MAKIISMINSKGGVGKTTLSVNLAVALFLLKNTGLGRITKELACDFREADILLVDADEQGSVRKWQDAGCRDDVRVIAADSRSTLANLRKSINFESYDYIIIDTPGKLDEVTGAAIALSHLCIIPVQPSPYDIWATEEIARVMVTRQAIFQGKPLAYYLLNRCINRANLNNDARECLKGCELPSLLSSCAQRVDYAKSAAEGETVFETQNADAKGEVLSVAKEIIKILEGQNG